MIARAILAALGLSACVPAADPALPGGGKGGGAAPVTGWADDRDCRGEPGSLRPLEGATQSSTIVLGRTDKGGLAKKLLAFVTDADGRAVALVDVDGKKPLGSIELPAAPGQLLVLPDGRLLATLPRADRVAVLRVADDGALSLACTRPTRAEPIAAATNKKADAVYVSSGWGAALEVFDGGLERKGTIELPREPRQVVVSDDERTLFVSHAVGGTISVIDSQAKKTLPPIHLFSDPSGRRDAEVAPLSLSASVEKAVGSGAPLVPGEDGLRVGQHGFALVKSGAPAGRLLLPQVMVDPGDPENRFDGYGSGDTPAVPNIAVIDASARKPLGASLVASEMRVFFDEGRRGAAEPSPSGCLLPRGAAYDDETATLLVACLGTGTVGAYDGASADPAAIETKRWDVGAGPTGVAVDAAGRRAIAWSQFERSVDILPLSELGAGIDPPARPRRDKIDLRPLAKPPPLPYLLGRQIFYGESDARISASGLACASCHLDGRDDALVWSTPDGPRRTPVLAGRMEGPFGWTGASEDVERHLDVEFRRLQGQGLRSVQRDALLAYLAALEVPSRRPAADRALAERGAKVFAEKGCATCHPAGGTDGKTHDVGSKASHDKKGTFDTPSLHRLAGRAPFFHDGRFATLRAVLEQPHGEKGATAKLDAKEIEALEAYLSTL